MKLRTLILLALTGCSYATQPPIMPDVWHSGADTLLIYPQSAFLNGLLASGYYVDDTEYTFAFTGKDTLYPGTDVATYSLRRYPDTLHGSMVISEPYGYLTREAVTFVRDTRR